MLTASLVLWHKPRNPPSIGARASSPRVDTAATARPELRSRLPFTTVHRTVNWPQHLHGSSPSTFDARVPATKDQAHDHTVRLTIHSSQPGVSTPHSSICSGYDWFCWRSSHVLHVAWMLTRHLQYLIRQFNFSKITDETKTNDIIFNPAMFVHKKK